MFVLLVPYQLEKMAYLFSIMKNVQVAVLVKKLVHKDLFKKCHLKDKVLSLFVQTEIQTKQPS